MTNKFDMNKEKNKPKKSKPAIKPALTHRRPTLFEQQQTDLTHLLESIIKDIQILYMNLENLMVCSTTIANINTALAKILINKKITTEKDIQKQYDIVTNEMKIKEKEIQDELKKFKSFENLDISGIDIKNMKVS